MATTSGGFAPVATIASFLTVMIAAKVAEVAEGVVMRVGAAATEEEAAAAHVTATAAMTAGVIGSAGPTGVGVAGATKNANAGSPPTAHTTAMSTTTVRAVRQLLAASVGAGVELRDVGLSQKGLRGLRCGVRTGPVVFVGASRFPGLRPR